MSGALAYLVGDGILHDHGSSPVITQGFGFWQSTRFIATEGFISNRVLRHIELDGWCLTIGNRETNMDSVRTVRAILTRGDDAVVYNFEETSVS